MNLSAKSKNFSEQNIINLKDSIDKVRQIFAQSLQFVKKDLVLMNLLKKN
jgi:hypothetical protein